MNKSYLFLFSAIGLLASALPGIAQDRCKDKQAAVVPLRKRGVLVRNFPVQKINGAILFTAGMEVDADGAPNAYGPGNKGLDFTANAMSGQKFVGVVTDKAGKPVMQQSGPFKGFYVSPTSLHASGSSLSDPSTYIDATKIPYIALPPELVQQFGVALGDLAVITNQQNGKSSFALYADVGPHGKIGEGSVALANALGLKSDPRRGGTQQEIISYLIFPKSGLGPGKLRILEEINTSANKIFTDWGGSGKLQECSSARDGQAASRERNESCLAYCSRGGKPCWQKVDAYFRLPYPQSTPGGTAGAGERLPATGSRL